LRTVPVTAVPCGYFPATWSHGSGWTCSSAWSATSATSTSIFPLVGGSCRCCSPPGLSARVERGVHDRRAVRAMAQTQSMAVEELISPASRAPALLRRARARIARFSARPPTPATRPRPTGGEEQFLLGDDPKAKPKEGEKTPYRRLSDAL